MTNLRQTSGEKHSGLQGDPSDPVVLVSAGEVRTDPHGATRSKPNARLLF